MALTNRVLFGWPMYSDVGVLYVPTLSGGAWSTDLPLTNLQDRRLTKVARSTDATLASTLFDLDLKTSRLIRMLAIFAHSLSTAAKVRARAFTTLPIIDWVTVGDGSWTFAGTPTRTPAATTVNGIPLDLVGDDDAASIEVDIRTVTGIVGNGAKVFSFVHKKFSSYASHRFVVFDNTAAAIRMTINIDNSGATPVVTIVGGLGTILSTTALPDGGYRTVAKTDAGLLAANTNQVRIQPAGNANADVASFYIGDIQAWNAATDQFTFDYGWQSVWPAIYPAGSLPADDPRAGAGTITAEEAIDYQMPVVIVPTTAPLGTFVRMEINDTANAAGYIDLGRLCVTGGYQPTVNPRYGVTLGWKTNTERMESDGGAAIFNEKARRRRVVIAFDGSLPQDEALVGPHEMMRKLGISGQVIFSLDPTATHHLHRWTFVGVPEEITPLDFPDYLHNGWGISVLEEL